MKLIYISLFFTTTILILSLGCVDSGSTTVSTEIKEVPLDSATQAFIDDYLTFFQADFAVNGSPGAALVIVMDGRIVCQKGYGEKIIGSGDSVDSRTVFRIGSLSKGLTSVLTGKMVQQGKLQWTDPVAMYYPAFNLKDKEQAKRIEIKHLISHTAGLPYQAYSNLIEQGFDLETIVLTYFPSAKLTGREGEVFAYQNAAFSVIEPVLYSATGRSFPDLITGELFVPANMLNASTGFEAMDQNLNKAFPHSLTESGWIAEDISSRYYNVLAAGGVNASISDMGQWLLLLLGNKKGVVADSTLTEVFKPVFRTGNERKVLPGWIDRDSASYALGWRVLNKNGLELIYHSGFVNNYYSEIAFDRKAGIGICVLFNGETQLLGTSIAEFFEKYWFHQSSQLNSDISFN